MRRLFLTCIAVLLIAGCNELWTGIGVGTAGTETFNQWKTNLEEKKAELATQYDEVLAELKAAPDPNAVAFAKEKLVAIQNAQVANESALFAISQVLQISGQESTGGRQDAVVASLIGAALIALREWQRRKEVGTLNNKYVAMKVGKAELAKTNPEAESQLHKLVGEERLRLGL